MKYKTKTNIIVVGVIAAIVIFGAGMKFGQSRSSVNTADDQNIRQAQGSKASMMGGRGFGGRGGGGTFGQVISVDDKSVTVQQRDGSSKIVFIAGSTSVTKSAPGSVKDLQVGQQITVTGTINSDGSETAQFIQIRPAQEQTGIQKTPTQQ